MKYTIDEEKQIVTIHSFNSKDVVADLQIALQGFEDFSICLEGQLKTTNVSMICDSPKLENPLPTKNPYEITGDDPCKVAPGITLDPKECDCSKNGALCDCSYKYKSYEG